MQEEVMYAVVETGGKQYRVAAGETIEVERLPVAIGEQVTLERVLMVGSDQAVWVGQPLLEGAQVQATVVGHLRGPKVIVFKYRPKKRYRRKAGHRQEITRLRIESIDVPPKVGG
jgi:large subunit ribosomal protein L21